MSADFEAVFASLRGVLERHAQGLAVQSDTAALYSLNTQAPSPLPQHKGHPMWFGSVRMGKTYVSFHLMPLYMNPALPRAITPLLKKRMQGKTCFNFKKIPEPELLAELDRLTVAAIEDWKQKTWV